MKKFWAGVFLLCACALYAGITEFTLKEGTSDMLSLQDVTKIMVKDEKVATAKTTGNAGKIMIMGGNFGKTELVYWRHGEESGPGTSISLTVTPRFWDELQAILIDYPQVAIDIAGERILLKGVVSSLADLEVVKKAMAVDAGNRIISLVTLDPDNVRKAIETILSRNTFEGIKVSVIGETVHLEGTLYDDARRKNLEDIAKSELAKYGMTLNMGAVVMAESNLTVDVQFLQVDHSKAKNLGIELSDLFIDAKGGAQYDRQRTVTTDGKTTTVPADRNFSWNGAVNASASARINTLLQAGAAKVAYDASFITRSGKPAELHQGGTLNIRVVSDNNVGVVPINYGLIVKATPKIVGHNSLSTEVMIEASVPLTRTGDIDISKYLNSSTFTVQAGERICLSGLNQMIELAGESGVPILSKIPVLGSLFKNYTDDNRQSKAYLIVKVDWKKVDSGALQEAGEAKYKELEVKLP
jgi:Flp pilus assembly secretin CpaC